MDGKGGTVLKRKWLVTRFFLLAFAATIAVFLIPSVVMLPKNQSKPADAGASGVPIVSGSVGSPAVEAGEEDRFTLLYVSTDADSLPLSFSLLRFCPDSAEIRLATLPGTWFYYGEDGPITLSDAYRRGGAAACGKVLENQLQIPVDRYLTVSAETEWELLETLGAAWVTLPSPVSYSSDMLSLQLPEGEQLLDAMGFYAAFHSQESPVAQSELLKALLEQNSKGLFSDRLEQLFQIAVNRGTTNLNRLDFEDLSPALGNLDGTCTVRVVSAQSMQIQSGEALSMKSMQELHENFAFAQRQAG